MSRLLARVQFRLAGLNHEKLKGSPGRRYVRAVIRGSISLAIRNAVHHMQCTPLSFRAFRQSAQKAARVASGKAVFFPHAERHAPGNILPGAVRSRRRHHIRRGSRSFSRMASCEGF